MAAKQIHPKLYVVTANGQDYLVRALTLNGAATGLVRSLIGTAKANTRLASQDELFDLAGRGVKPIDVGPQEKIDDADEATE